VEKEVVREVVREVEVREGPTKEDLLEIESKLARETDEYKSNLDAERKRLAGRRDVAETEKQGILNDLKAKEEEYERERAEQQKMLEKLKAMEDKMLQGSDVMAKALQQEKQLKKAKRELAERERQEKDIQDTLAQQEEERVNIEEKFAGVEEQVTKLTAKLKKLWDKYKSACNEITDLHQEFQQEREDMLETIRDLTQEMKLKNSILENFVPKAEFDKMYSRAHWNEEEDEWELECVDDILSQQAWPKRPSSALGFRRPTTEFARNARAMGDPNPRFRHDQILSMDLEMPERTTEDYELNPVFNERILQSLMFALAEEESGRSSRDERHRSRDERSARPSSAVKHRKR